MMIDKIDYDNETFIYYLYTPSPVLYQNFLLFTQYLTHFKKTSHDTKLIMFEADVNLTLMELRGIDVLHRYVGKLSQQLEKETDIPLDEIQKENKIIENQLNKSMGEIYELMQEIPIYRPIYRILVNLLKNNKRDYE
jgi:CO dehydrogenase nickel-insertion accessory protein CooC1